MSGRGERAPQVAAAPRPEPPPCDALQRPFKALIFDWDGTAVTDRKQDARPLAALVEPLLASRVWVVVVTGTNFGNIERQFCRLIAAGRRHHLLVCSNRGSEVYGFGRRGQPVRRWLRAAAPEEERALTAAAEAVRDRLKAETGLDIRIVYDRLNRRKIDLIPLAEWADPPKARIGELLQAVQARLRGDGWSGGLSAAIRLSERLARQNGLPDARITSDVKHIEIGLTDKGDSLDWVKREVLRPGGIAMADALVAGDEFGPVAGFAGSDDRLRERAEDAVVVSVGAEPNGVPEGVWHLGGGPAHFAELLAAQGRLYEHRPAEDWTAATLAPAPDPAWRLEEHNYNPALEHEVESRFAIANGLLGVRGSMEQPTNASRPRTYVAGVFDKPGEAPALPALAAAPDWLRLRLAIDGEPLSIEVGEPLDHSRMLDLPRGLLLGAWQHRTAAGHVVRLDTLRFASMADRRLAAQIARIDVERPATVELEAWLEPADGGLAPVRAAPGLAIWRTRDGKQQVALASHATLRAMGAVVPPRVSDDGHWLWTWTALPGETARLSRTIAAVRDGTERDADAAAAVAMRRARRMGPRRLLAAHEGAWQRRWAASGVEIEGDEAAQRALRFAVYHLNGAANPDDERVSIAARGLTGDGYLGHVFWDTEIYLLPFYTLTWPRAARALLMYRYHTLPAARSKAARLGYRGALYAWESADSGEETTPELVVGPDGRVIRILSGMYENHISADVAFAVWQYWQATADAAFLLDAGAEIVLETARFWASRARREMDGYHICGVIGPDEYHQMVDDNAYTNGMASWNLECGVEVAALLKARWPRRWAALARHLRLTDAELAVWREIAERLVTGLDSARGLYEQFSGFFDLEPVDLAAYADRAAPMDVVLGPERTARTQVIKQADVVMLLALLWDRFSPEARRANFRYYEPRCGHGSSLSPASHALVAARLGDVDLADRYLHQAAAIDLDDTMGNAAAGVHMGALGGLWQAVVLGMAGVAMRPDGLRIDPHLPSGWRAVRFPVRWRGRLVRVAVERHAGRLSVRTTLESGAPLAVEVDGIARRLAKGRSWTWQQAADGRWKEAAT